MCEWVVEGVLKGMVAGVVGVLSSAYLLIDELLVDLIMVGLNFLGQFRDENVVIEINACQRRGGFEVFLCLHAVQFCLTLEAGREDLW